MSMSYDHYLDVCHERDFSEQETCDCMEITCDACCGENGYLRSLVHVTRSSEHVARKDHYSQCGKVLLVKAGQRYKYYYDRQVVEDKNDGKIFASVDIQKIPVSKTLQDRINRLQKFVNSRGIFQDDLNKYKKQLNDLQEKGEA